MIYILFLFFFFFCILFSYSSFVSVREQQLLGSKEYKDAVLEWEKLQVFFLFHKKSKFKPFSVLAYSNSLVGYEVSVVMDRDGKLLLSPYPLNPSEFISAVNGVKRCLSLYFHF